jgi:uncharacterized protein involved in response to NO
MRDTAASSSAHAPFSVGFVYAALGVTLSAGFGYAAVLGVSFGFGHSLGAWWTPLVQTHGHAQLWGWTGLFIIGVSLYFAPRLVGAPLRHARLSPWVCWLAATGILVRAVAQPLCAVYREGTMNVLLRCGLGGSAVAEAAAIGGYTAMLFFTLRSAHPMKNQEGVQSFRFYLIPVMFGWVCTTLLSSGLTLAAAFANTPVVNIPGTTIAVSLYLGLVLLPVTMIFSIRTFPLYLRLPRPQRPIQTVGLLYLAGFWIELLGLLMQTATGDTVFSERVAGAGKTMKGAMLLWFVWKLDILLRRKAPWTVERVEQVVRHIRRQPREHLPDYGEFGRFERLLYSAYVWLVVGAAMDIANGLGALAGWPVRIPADAVRHVYLAGFVSLLLLGMAPRMIPGFMHRRAPAYPRLVDLTCWLGNLAAVCRVVPALMPAGMEAHSPGSAGAPGTMLGLSGIAGWLAVLALAWNLVATLRGLPAAPSS